MSEPILPLRQWPAGIQQASVPANDNALRLEALSRPVLGVADDEESGAVGGDVWIVGTTPTGAFASFDENDLALYHVNETTEVGGWQAWAPVVGLRVVVNDVRKVFSGGAWIDDPSITGGGGASEHNRPTLVVPDATRIVSAFDAGYYLHFSYNGAKTVTFDVGEDFAEPDEFWLRNGNAGDLTIVLAGITANPAGADLVLAYGQTAMLKFTAMDAVDIVRFGGGGGSSIAPVVTASGTSLTADDTNAGNYTRFTNSSAKTYTFDSAETYTVGDEYHGRNVGAGTLTITEAGTFTINPPAGGTLDIPQGGTFTVKIVASDEADLFGVTEVSS